MEIVHYELEEKTKGGDWEPVKTHLGGTHPLTFDEKEDAKARVATDVYIKGRIRIVAVRTTVRTTRTVVE